VKGWLRSIACAAAGVGFLAAAGAGFAADTIKTRQAVMAELGAHTKAVGAFLKGNEDPRKSAALGSAGDVEFRATAMASLAKRLPSFFPKGTSSSDMPGKTRAKPEIWTRSDKFMAAAATLENLSNKLAEAAATEDKSRIAAVMKTLGKDGCGGCHATFRGPKPKGAM